MSRKKSQVRASFRRAVFERDSHRCQVCGRQWAPGDGDPALKRINAHHITDRSEMPNGGYVLENGITVCEDPCHTRVELYHSTAGRDWHDNLHPDDLYAKIGGSSESALQASGVL